MTTRSRPDATERVMELMMYLLARDVPKTREQIWRDTGLYAPEGTTDRLLQQSARASFERDKALIRNLGVRITESMEHDGATSYTIRRQDYFLPDIRLTPDEQLALRIAAARVDIGETWDLEAVAKLTSAGSAEAVRDVEPATAEVALETASASQPAASTMLPVLAAAAAERAAVRFAYGGRQRAVQPLGLLCRAGYWYFAAIEDGTAKTFRVDRLEGDAVVGDRGAFAKSDVDVAGLLPAEPMEIDFGDNFDARVRIDATMAQQPTAERGRIVERHDDGSVTVEARVRNRVAFRTWLLDMGRHAVVQSPPELVSEITSWLRALAPDGGEAGR